MRAETHPPYANEVCHLNIFLTGPRVRTVSKMLGLVSCQLNITFCKNWTRYDKILSDSFAADNQLLDSLIQWRIFSLLVTQTDDLSPCFNFNTKQSGSHALAPTYCSDSRGILAHFPQTLVHHKNMWKNFFSKFGWNITLWDYIKP